MVDVTDQLNQINELMRTEDPSLTDLIVDYESFIRQSFGIGSQFTKSPESHEFSEEDGRYLGCLRFEKNRTKVRYYPRIEFGFASQRLTNDLFVLISCLGFRAYKWRDRDYHKIGLAGFMNLEKWMKEISPKNSKHFKRYVAWRNIRRDGPMVRR